MTTNSRRLAKLATLWPVTDRPTDPRGAEFYDTFIDAPALPVVLWRFAQERAHWHYEHDLAAGMADPPSTPYRRDIGAWYALGETTWEVLTQRELDGLRIHQRALGEEVGWEVWMAEAEAWTPPVPARGRALSPANQEMFDRHYQSELSSRAQHRRGEKWAGWRRRTGWREGMTDAEERTFDRGLTFRTAREGEEGDQGWTTRRPAPPSRDGCSGCRRGMILARRSVTPAGRAIAARPAGLSVVIC